MSMLGIVIALILAQTLLVGVLLWRFRQFETDALHIANKQTDLEQRMHLLEQQVFDG